MMKIQMKWWRFKGRRWRFNDSREKKHLKYSYVVPKLNRSKV